jgi:hypothetical protein
MNDIYKTNFKYCDSSDEEINSNDIKTISKAEEALQTSHIQLPISRATFVNTDEESPENSSVPVEQIFSAAKLLENLNNFKEKYENDIVLKLNEISNDDLTLSFLTHYIAIDLIYSPKVNTKYDELKEENSTDNSLFDLSNIDAGNFQVEFLSRLRLLMKLDKRRITHETIQKNNTCWKICETNIFIETQFDFKDEEERRRKNENVMMKVKSSPDTLNFERLTYTQYINELTPVSLKIFIEKRINITQDAIKSLQDDQKEIFMALWYTIFGVEVSRNPASLIHINMFLDLIQAGKISWSSFYEYFPMSESGIVVKAKNLNYYYNDYMPHKHKYDFDTIYNIYINILIKREALITKEWLKFKLEGKEIKDCSTIENIEKIHKTIQESLNGWKFNF